MKYKLVIFDFDGVIQDSWEHSYGLNLRDWADLSPEQHRNLFNGNIYEAYEKMPPSAMSKEEREKFIQTEFYESKKKLSIFPGIDVVIRKMAEVNVLVVNTSAYATSTKE